ncbi:MAG: hypothetical protein IJB71_04710 [Bacilli bacterium]|nr:hypothetical protein [Bacilli bacterium]
MKKFRFYETLIHFFTPVNYAKLIKEQSNQPAFEEVVLTTKVQKPSMHVDSQKTKKLHLARKTTNKR